MPTTKEYYEANTDSNAGTMRPTLFGSMIGGGLPGSPKMAEVPIGWQHRSTEPSIWEMLTGSSTRALNKYLGQVTGWSYGQPWPTDPYPSSTTPVYKSDK